ncbi:MAG: glutamate--tRNA ligase [Hyphomicrobiaceae bacterium]|nr:glutamate--tRNA ligase [Hyphomicrobiaceae bacterium]
MSVVVRFAPSPTGRLHIGNVRTAVLNWLYARKHGGTFILRLDDTDRQRSTDELAAAIREDLTWLGLTWARGERQSARTARYDEIAGELKRAGRLYPCYETADELDRRRKRQLARGSPPIYDRAALKLTEEERGKLEAEGRRPYWRFRLANTEPGEPLEPLPTLVSWVDLVRRDQSVDVGSLSDPVLIRADGTFLYTFTSVVDDIEFGVTHVIRGEDHVTNTGVQIQLFEALGAEPPAFGHHSLLVDATGQALSKRLGHLSVAALRDAGFEPMAIVSQAALLGTSEAIEPHRSLDELAALVDLESISRAPARFDEAELRSLNARLLHSTPYRAVADRLEARGVTGGEAFWLAVRGNVTRIGNAVEWWAVISQPVRPVIEDQQFCARAAELLPPPPWDESVWETWTAAVSADTGRKGRALFHPLRLALTGREQGPELKALLPLIGPGRAAARLKGETA